MNFVKVLNEEVAKCEVMLALIGPNWLNARNEDGNRRLDDETDYVRIEIQAALERNIPVIPILLDGATTPKANQLPKAIEELALRSALDVRYPSFHNDMDTLIQALKDQLDRTRIIKVKSALKKVLTRLGKFLAGLLGWALLIGGVLGAVNIILWLLGK
jgi:hypothetical protein